jgi:hypothetical protein
MSSYAKGKEKMGKIKGNIPSTVVSGIQIMVSDKFMLNVDMVMSEVQRLKSKQQRH